MFHDILHRKTSFKDYKNSKLKKVEKIGFFHGFGHKLAILHVFVLVEIGKKYVFYDILERKNAFVDNKNNIFFSRCFHDILERKQSLSRLQKQEVKKKIEKLDFL